MNRIKSLCALAALGTIAISQAYASTQDLPARSTFQQAYVHDSDEMALARVVLSETSGTGKDIVPLIQTVLNRYNVEGDGRSLKEYLYSQPHVFQGLQRTKTYTTEYTEAQLEKTFEAISLAKKLPDLTQGSDHFFHLKTPAYHTQKTLETELNASYHNPKYWVGCSDVPKWAKNGTVTVHHRDTKKSTDYWLVTVDLL